tara:strand:- start:851 stop:1630 length:780 start_codon:yes stop_codon:yes gene_type:complete
MTHLPLSGQSALVTGASSGIGRAIALRLAEAGATVWATDITGDAVEGGPPVADPLSEISPASCFVRLDVRDHAACAALCAQIAQTHGRLDLVVPSAMTPGRGSLPQTTPEDWKRVMGVNVDGVYNVLSGTLAQMLAQEPLKDVRGRVVIIGSQHGMVASPGGFAYGVSKAAVLQMMRQIAVEHAEEGIICNAVSPGKILTGKTGPAIAPEMIAYSEARTPMPRLGRPADVAQAVLFLADPETTFVTGHNLLVDGGWMAG